MMEELNAASVLAPSDRRRNIDRRVSISASVSERRCVEDRRNQEDRRGHYHNLFNPNDEFLYEVFIWLIDCTEGSWFSGANEHEPDDSLVTCRIRFEKESDLEAFIAWLSVWQDKHR